MTGAAPSRPNRMVVDLGAIRDNAAAVRRLVGPGIELVACLKANAYGHGAVAVAPSAVRGGATGAAVGDLETALALRAAGIEGLLLLYPGPAATPPVLSAASDAKVTLTIGDEDAALELSAAVPAPMDVFIKVDVGLNRLGVAPADATSLARVVTSAERLRLVGVLTHLNSPPDSSIAYLQGQLDRFSEAMDHLDAEGLLPPQRMAASSGPLVWHDRLSFDSRLTAVDPGQLLYGIVRPGSEAVADYTPAFRSLTSQITQVKTVARAEEPAGPSTGASQPGEPAIRVGIVPIGRGDGYADLSPGWVLVRGQAVPIITTWIEHTAIDLSALPDVRRGEDVVLFGPQLGSSISAGDVLDAHPGMRPVDVSLVIRASVARSYVSDRDTPG